jgi:hypothetical protein
MKWLGLGLAVWAGGGCLLPQEEDYLNEFPIPRNRPPRIVEKQVQPPDRIIRGYGSDTCELQFSVAVEDPDLGDNLTAHWFIDYDPTQPRGADNVDTLGSGDRELRDPRADFNPRFGSVEYSRLNTPGEHVVEVIVSDNGLVGREANPFIHRLQDGTDFKDPGYTATYVWFVRTEPAGGDCQ